MSITEFDVSYNSNIQQWINGKLDRNLTDHENNITNMKNVFNKLKDKHN